MALFNRRPNIVKIIQTGNLKQLKKALEKYPDIVDEDYTWETPKNTDNGNLLHGAAIYNDPEIINHLVGAVGMDINKTNDPKSLTPIYFAVWNNSYEAAQTLMQHGAQITPKHARSIIKGLNSPHNIAKTANLLLPYCKEIVKQEEEQLKAEDAQKAAEDLQKKKEKAQGAWTSPAPDLVVYSRELNDYRLTEVFNFSTQGWKSITEKLDNGQFVPETKTFADAPAEMLARAKEKRDELNGTSAAKKPKKQPANNYKHLIDIASG